jgi:hypothetical protein
MIAEATKMHSTRVKSIAENTDAAGSFKKSDISVLNYSSNSSEDYSYGGFFQY